MFVVAQGWQGLPEGQLYGLGEFVAHPGAGLVVAALLGVAVTGGMFVVPLYAFLTTTVAKDQTARTVAANNIVNSGAMVLGAALVLALTWAGLSVLDTLLLVAGMCLVSAWLAWKLHKACDHPLPSDQKRHEEDKAAGPGGREQADIIGQP
jgi:hypothetical protein